ncbi:hypothetical protein BN2497_5191 [Janthinobacterium sp. CG23_2]|nr:hypothetical protein BN2497_5191 [Janthinobacterium sp. CG23_2]CUU28993.1 hypothetical protein BN3177_5191 [Janthinobacterium sp. CG23_2]
MDGFHCSSPLWFSYTMPIAFFVPALAALAAGARGQGGG